MPPQGDELGRGMSKSGDLNFLYYEKEMSFLRQMGRIFAAKYPKVARRLNFTENLPTDPHIERLIESFAFMSGYLQQDIDNQFPRISSALLDVLYPFLTTIVPSMAIGQFNHDRKKAITSGSQIPKNFPLFTKSVGGTTCRFRTAFPLELWPIQTTGVSIVKRDIYTFGNQLAGDENILKISLKSMGPAFSKLDPKKLRFHINLPIVSGSSLYRFLFQNSYKIAVVSTDTDSNPIFLKEGSLHQVGFELDEAIIPCPPNAHPAYGLLMEYFHFPQKFMFFDVENLTFPEGATTVDILIPLAPFNQEFSIPLDKYSIVLGCSPIVNLYSCVSDPIRFDRKKIEYRLVGDRGRETTCEIYSIEKVFSSGVDGREVSEIFPYFSYNHHEEVSPNRIFWTSRRVPSLKETLPGTDVFLSFVNWDMQPHLPDTSVVYARTLCTNRQLASRLTANTLLFPEEKIPVESIFCIHTPTEAVYPSLEGATQWKLISNLALNNQSFSSNIKSLEALKEMLMLYAGSSFSVNEGEINRLISMTCEPIVRRMGVDAWRGFLQGTGITLIVDDVDSTGAGVFLLGSVLSRFFALHTDINSFTELSIKSIHQTGILKTWPVVAGAKAFL
jgi:type VI secretion system protein ImpG